MLSRALCLCALLISALSATPAFALSFTEGVPALQEMAESAPLSFRGVVESIEYDHAFIDEERALPFTVTTLRVLRGYAGCKAGAQITLIQMGGADRRKPHVHWVIHGLVELAEGDEVVVFSDDRRHPLFGTAYGDYGMLRIATDEAGRRGVFGPHWRPKVREGAQLVTHPQGICFPQSDDPRRCSFGGDGGPKVQLRVPELDAWLAQHAAFAPQELQPQLISHDRERFRALLSAFGRRDAKEMQRIFPHSR